MLTLAALKRGQRAVVADVEGVDGVAIRLMEMGLVPGAEVEYLGAAPLGDPLEFEVCGYRLSLRSSEAQRVFVEARPPEAARPETA